MDKNLEFWILLTFLASSIVEFEGTRMECSVDLCSWDKKEMTCNDSVILLQNVTGVRTQLTNEREFVNLRRMCNGFSQCTSDSYCRHQKVIRASYLCIKRNQIHKECPDQAQILATNEGYIQSPDYPSALALKRCVWRIIVPDDSYITFVLHDFQRDVPEHSPCNGGLRILTNNECSRSTFPSRDICRMREDLTSFSACGNVEVNFLPGDRGYKMRFWMSFKVRKLNTLSETSRQDGLPSHSEHCPNGYYDDINNKETSIPQSPTEIFPHYNTSNNNTVLQESINRNAIINTDSTEKTVLYVAVVVAIISMTGLIIVTAICIRQRWSKPSRSTTAEHHVLSHNGTINRPLPPVLRPNSLIQDCPRLDEGYSVVADEIPYTPTDGNVRSPAYAEVEDHMLDRGQRFRFGQLSVNSKHKKSVENIYSELSDGKDRNNVYHEISDDTFVPSPILSNSDHDQTQLIGAKRSSKILQFGPKPGKRPVSFEGPYANNDVTNRRNNDVTNRRSNGVTNRRSNDIGSRRSVTKDMEKNKLSLSKSGSLSYRSDSDGSLVIENEIYDAYQSAHV